MTTNGFTWIPAYEGIADAVLARKDRRDEVLAQYVEVTGADDRVAIDPLTFFTSFNRGIVAVDRRSMVRGILKAFDVDAPVPTDFLGIPTANHELWQYFDDSAEAAEDCWALFETALALADAERPDEGLVREFSERFDAVHAQENVTKARITRTLYWMRPNFYLPFGEKTRNFVHGRYGINTPITMKGIQYIRLLQEVNAVVDDPFYEVTARAYRTATDGGWWPDHHDYDPDMSIHQWMVLLSDPEITSDEELAALRKIRDRGGEGTVDELAEERIHDREYYNQLLRGYAKKTAREMGRTDYHGSWWPFIFTGRNADADHYGDYVWKLRPEISEALSALDENRE